MNNKRNKPMTNAERQRRYRDRKRGGPPRGRWAGCVPARKWAQQYGISRTSFFYAKWIREHAPEVSEEMAAGRVKLAPTYRALKAKYDAALSRAVRESDNDKMQAAGYSLTGKYVDGDFEFWWVHPTKRPRRATKRPAKKTKATRKKGRVNHG